MISHESSEWKLKSKNNDFIILIVYRPPYSKQHPISANIFIEEFQNHLNKLIQTLHKMIVTGYFNFLVDNINNAESRRFLDLLEEYGLVNWVSFQTHIHCHSLDLIVTKSSN